MGCILIFYFLFTWHYYRQIRLTHSCHLDNYYNWKVKMSRGNNGQDERQTGSQNQTLKCRNHFKLRLNATSTQKRFIVSKALLYSQPWTVADFKLILILFFYSHSLWNMRIYMPFEKVLANTLLLSYADSSVV